MSCSAAWPRWPDVASVAVAFTTPMSYLIGGGSIYIEGQPVPATSQPPASFMNHVGHNYFDVMGIPIVRGRAFVEDDEREHSTTRKVAIVNESMAAKYWPGQDPIGKRFRAFNLDEPLLEVVGVARDSKYVLVFESPRPYIYLAARARPVAAHAARARRRAIRRRSRRASSARSRIWRPICRSRICGR